MFAITLLNFTNSATLAPRIGSAEEPPAAATTGDGVAPWPFAPDVPFPLVGLVVVVVVLVVVVEAPGEPPVGVEGAASTRST